MAQVKIRHPVSGGEATVPECSLRHHQRAGWVRVDGEPAPGAPPAGEDGAATGGEGTSQKGDRKR